MHDAVPTPRQRTTHERDATVAHPAVLACQVIGVAVETRRVHWALKHQGLIRVDEKDVFAAFLRKRQRLIPVVCEVNPRAIDQHPGLSRHDLAHNLLRAVSRTRVTDDPSIHEGIDGPQAPLDNVRLVLDDHAQTDLWSH